MQYFNLLSHSTGRISSHSVLLKNLNHPILLKRCGTLSFMVVPSNLLDTKFVGFNSYLNF